MKLFLLWTFHHPCRATISIPLKDHVAPHPHYFLLFSAHLLNISLFLLAASQQTAVSNPEHFSFFLWPVRTDFIEPCKNIFAQQENMTPSFLFIVPILSWAVWLSALNHSTLVVSVFREQLIVTQGSLWTESGEQGLIIKYTVAAAHLRFSPHGALWTHSGSLVRIAYSLPGLAIALDKISSAGDSVLPS